MNESKNQHTSSRWPTGRRPLLSSRANSLSFPPCVRASSRSAGRHGRRRTRCDGSTDCHSNWQCTQHDWIDEILVRGGSLVESSADSPRGGATLRSLRTRDSNDVTNFCLAGYVCFYWRRAGRFCSELFGRPRAPIRSGLPADNLTQQCLKVVSYDRDSGRNVGSGEFTRTSFCPTEIIQLHRNHFVGQKLRRRACARDA